MITKDSAQMPRPPKSSSNRTRRDEILDEATRLFAERGYEGASMADLAEAVGMRKASLFYHFASKEVLYAAVIERLLVSFGAAIQSASLTEGSFEERLDGLTHAIVGVLGSQPFAARLMVREVMDWGPVIRGTLADSMVMVLAGATEFVKAGQAAGVFAEGDPRQLILSVLGIHFMPFAITGLVEKMVQVAPIDPAFVEEREKAARLHVRGVVLARAAKAASEVPPS
jgi:AcrR family transcriptional regulator